jgi:hypothetical protein
MSQNNRPGRFNLSIKPRNWHLNAEFQKFFREYTGKAFPKGEKSNTCKPRRAR